MKIFKKWFHSQIVCENLTSMVILFTATFLFSACKRNIIEPHAIVSNTNSASAVSMAAGADFVNVATLGALGNNTDATQALQDAIDTQLKVYIPKGTYIISKPLVKTSGALIIIADSAIIRLSSSFPRSSNIYTGALVVNNLTQLSITGLTIDGNRAKLINAGADWRNYIMGLYAKSCNNILLKYCNIINSPSMSFSFHDCSLVRLFDCSSTNSMFHGVEVRGCTNTTISRFKFTGIGNQGTNTAVGGIGIVGTLSNYLSILDCLIQDSPDTGTKTEGCNYVTWDGNTVRNSGKDGIKFQNLIGDATLPDVPTVYHATITHNTVDKIYNGRSDGSSLIQVWNGENVEVSNNHITGGIKTGYEAGIQVWSSSGITKDIVIINNRITNTNRFIYISNVSDMRILNNYCQSTIDPISPNGNGFEAESSNNFVVSGNHFIRHDTTVINGSGVYLFNCSSFSFTDNTVGKANSGLDASFTSCKTINISHNTWNNFGRYFACVCVNSLQAIDSLLLNDNTISKIGTGPFLFKVTSKYLTLKFLNVKNTKVVGNGSNRHWGIEIPVGGHLIKTDLTNFATTGNAVYPINSALRGTSKIIGWKSTAAPKSGTWSTGDIVYDLNGSTATAGWLCTVGGTPGVWISVP